MNLDALVGVMLAGMFMAALGILFLAGLTVKFMLWLISVIINGWSFVETDKASRSSRAKPAEESAWRRV